jgi:hypothetical protein
MGNTYLSRNVVYLYVDSAQFSSLVCHVSFVSFYGHVARISSLFVMKLFPWFYGTNHHSYSKPISLPEAAISHFFHASALEYVKTSKPPEYSMFRIYLSRVGFFALFSTLLFQLFGISQITSAAR